MKIGAMNHPKNDLVSEIQIIAEQGFDFIDLTYEWPSNLKINIKEIKKLLNDLDLEIVGHTSPTLPAIYPLKEIGGICVLELKKAADFFKEINCPRMNIHPFYYSPFRDEKEILEANMQVLKEINNYCQETGIELMLENFITPFNKVETFQKVFNEIPSLKLHLDIAHLNLSNNLEGLLKDFLAKFSDRLIHCHIHDNHGEADEHLPLGCGDIDWKFVARELKNNGYDRTFTLEVFSQDQNYLIYSKEKWFNLWLES